MIFDFLSDDKKSDESKLILLNFLFFRLGINAFNFFTSSSKPLPAMMCFSQIMFNNDVVTSTIIINKKIIKYRKRKKKKERKKEIIRYINT